MDPNLLHNMRPQSRGPQSSLPRGAKTPSRVAPPGTSSGRMGTAMQGNPTRAVGLLADVKVQDRPLTQMGVHINQQKPKAQGRQIYDRSFYMNNLRQKIGEIKEQLHRFNQEMLSIQEDNNTFTALEKRYESLCKTVRQLEGELADHNLTLDKLRTDTRVEEVQYLYRMLKQQNDQQRTEMDNIFLEKKQHEEDIRKFDVILESFTKEDEARLSELHPEQRAEYDRLQQSNKAINLTNLRMEVEQVSQNLNMAESRLRQEPLRLRMQEQKERKAVLSQKFLQLEQSAKESMLSIPEQRELLLQRVKDNNADILSTETKSAEVRREVENYRKSLEEIRGMLMENNTDGGNSERSKYEVLFSKDEEMSKFLENFPTACKEEKEKIEAKQAEILILLEDISKFYLNIGGKDNKFVETLGDDITDELQFKQTQLEQSNLTNQKLGGQVEKRKIELEKIRNLDNKITSELQQLESKMRLFKEEMNTKYLHAEEMEREKRAQTEELTNRKGKLENRLSQLQNHIHFLQIRVEGKKQQLAENETNQNLEALESKIRQYEQNIYHLQTFITTKEAESDYSQQKASVLENVESINKILVQNCFKMGGIGGF